MNSMTKYEKFALDEWLTKYPDNMAYDQIILMLRSETMTSNQIDSTHVWHRMEEFSLKEISGFIEDTKAHLERVFSKYSF